jgi:hypothetical protein
LVISFLKTISFASNIFPYEDCEIDGKALYVKKFKDTKENEINFVNKEKKCEIEIKSNNSGSMLVKKVGLESKKYKYINFQLKVADIIKGADLTKKSGDDAAARVYIFYRYEKEKAGFFEKLYRNYSKNESDGNSIVYIWGNNEKKGDVIENPYSDKFIQIIVESGTENAGKYIKFKQNVYEDFKKHFKYDPPETISSIAIMTDTDNTGAQATGYFKDIFFNTD